MVLFKVLLSPTFLAIRISCNFSISGEIGKAPAVVDNMPSVPQGATAEPQLDSESEEEDEVNKMQQRLAMLRS